MKIIDRQFLSVKTRTCHASTIAFHNNEPVFAWFGGQREGLPDSCIFLQYKNEIKELGSYINMPYWNPVLFKVEDELFLSYKVGKFCDCWQTYILNITDLENCKLPDESGRQVIPAGLNFCVKTKPLIIDDIIYCGSSVETSLDWTSYIERYIYEDGKFEYKDRSRPLTAPKVKYTHESKLYGTRKIMYSQGIIQPSLFKGNDDILHAFFRSSGGLENIYHSYCENYTYADDGWTNPVPLSYSNPNSSVDTVCMNDRLFLVYNPSPNSRMPLVVDEVKDFNETVERLVITEEITEEDFTERGVITPELSYPFMIEQDGKLHLTYTYGRSKIEHVTIEV